MIIYQAQPARLYPHILESILPNIKMQKDEFHYPFQVKSIYKWLNQNNILTGIPKDSLHIRTDGFLYGVFSSSHLNLQLNDFVFTILNHPVDHIYETYIYFKFSRNPITPNFFARNDERNLDPVIAQTKVFQTLEDFTLEKYINLILEDYDFSFKYLDIDYLTAKEAIYGFSDFSHFSHVGKFSELEKTFKKLNQIFNVELHIPQDLRVNSYVGEYYKRDLLEQKFKKEIEFYENL
jgi:hypothetical protein